MPRIAFMGTPEFAVPALLTLAGTDLEIVRVYTRPPRRAGRGQLRRPSPIHKTAERLGIEVCTPESLREEAVQTGFRTLGLDAAVVAAYGQILPPPILDAPRRGCINIHASLLPRWRGAAPIQRAILAGDTVSGITIMQMDPGLDTGPILCTERVPVGPDTTSGQLHDKLAAVGAQLILKALGTEALRPHPQPTEGVTYAAKITKQESRIDWSRSADQLERTVRGFNPWPGAWCLLSGTRLSVHRARVVTGTGHPGTVIDHPLTIACGENALALQQVQMAGRSAMAACDFVRGCEVAIGTVMT